MDSSTCSCLQAEAFIEDAGVGGYSQLRLEVPRLAGNHPRQRLSEGASKQGLTEAYQEQGFLSGLISHATLMLQATLAVE